MSTWRTNRVFTIHSFKPNAYHIFLFLAPVVFSNISTFFLSKEILPIMRYLCKTRTDMFDIFSYIQLINYTVLYIRCQFGAQVVCLLFTEVRFESYVSSSFVSSSSCIFKYISTNNFVERNITQI